MKNILAIIFAFIVLGCTSSRKPFSGEDNQEAINKTSKNLNETAPYNGSVMLLGKSDRTGLQMEEFKSWFAPGYSEYAPNPEIMQKLKPLIKDVEITLFMGTWCEDSHRDVPHLYKILDDLHFKESKLTVYAVSESKTTPQGFENGKNILQVPTIIFYRNGKEVNRIVEYSIYTLEQDMLDILSGKDYKNPYSE